MAPHMINRFETFLKRHRALRRFRLNFDKYQIQQKTLPDYMRIVYARKVIKWAFIWSETPEANEKYMDYWYDMDRSWQKELDKINATKQEVQA
jgi:hypothetical protein